ncbi:hypothetical protein AGR2A_Cc100281 [Agrobacterium genomosp. 2 str. CFBP 5494]|uniref:Uncharacterized protein n=1 Tax=Agrobacterium genomosp. 2 str. CFBP 5494 TaxID=1183436 RepID=A0A9W5AXN6_9HYPH|nr:hypothetical protein AGR2A_Cc100281 [Agrobacterium genomosp. 2 str. CFBP 5494]
MDVVDCGKNANAVKETSHVDTDITALPYPVPDVGDRFRHRVSFALYGRWRSGPYHPVFAHA